MIELELTRKCFADQVVLGPMQLHLAPGERVAVQGPSGVGKSSLLRIIAGLDSDFEGACRVQGRLAMVFQEPTLLPWRDALDNICLITGADADQARAALDEVGLADKAGQYPRQLSLGQQRRLALARALAARPDILILDEPFASLDEEVAQDMIALTGGLIRSHGMSALLVTHSRAEAEALSDRILRLQGAPAQLQAA